MNPDVSKISLQEEVDVKVTQVIQNSLSHLKMRYLSDMLPHPTNLFMRD